MLALFLALWLAFAAVAFGANTHGTGDEARERASWFSDTVGPFIASGCLPTVPAASLTMTAFACTGYVQGVAGELSYVTQAAATVTLANTNGVHWVAVHKDTQAAVASWTRRAGSHYLFRQVTAKPADPTGGLIVAKITVVGGVITAVEDRRPPASYARRGVYALNDPLYGGACNATSADTQGAGTDNVAAWALAVGAAQAQGGILWVPKGFCWFASQPAALSGGITVVGEGQDVTYLIRGYVEADASQGFMDMDIANTGDLWNLGGGVRDVTLWAASGTTGGSGVDIVASATAAQGRIYLDFLRVSGSGTWNYNVRIDGSLNNTASPGVRFVSVRSAFLAQAATAGLLAIGFNHLLLDGIGIYTGSGSADLILDGGTGGTVPSHNAVVWCEFCTTVEIGKTQATQGVHFTTQHTTTLTTSVALSLFTASGSIGTHTGVYNTASPNNISFFGGGKVGAGIPSFTAAGAQLESADGLTFPATQVVSADAHTLDDYEEDVFTPTIDGTSTAGAGTYTTQVGWYTKTGDMVHANLQLVWTAHTGTGNMQISGLPFSAKNATGFISPCSVWYSNLVVGAGTQLTAYIISNTAVVTLRASDPGGGATAAITLDVAASLAVQCTYKAAN